MATDTDGIEMRIRIPVWFCRVCKTYVRDPENHQWHAAIGIETPPETPETPKESP